MLDNSGKCKSCYVGGGGAVAGGQAGTVSLTNVSSMTINKSTIKKDKNGEKWKKSAKYGRKFEMTVEMQCKLDNCYCCSLEYQTTCRENIVLIWNQRIFYCLSTSFIGKSFHTLIPGGRVSCETLLFQFKLKRTEVISVYLLKLLTFLFRVLNRNYVQPKQTEMSQMKINKAKKTNEIKTTLVSHLK
jgi:hypothetical protein